MLSKKIDTSKGFIRTTENFVCEKCGLTVFGNGYTNHCPRCLWSKHVDIKPGDRAEKCGGMMEPVKIEKEHNEFVVTHKCTKCGFTRRNKTVQLDNMDEIIRLSAMP